jgi:hypothetical protein
VNGPARIHRAGTMNGLATGAKQAIVFPPILVAAGYRLSDGKACIYSGLGPDGGRNGPDFAAPAERSIAIPWINTTGNASGSHAMLSGTSAAAPQLARSLVAHLRNMATNAPAIATSALPSEDMPALGSGRI